jgi:hypothetical protein
MDGTEPRGIEDVGLHLPKGMNEEAAEPFIAYVAAKAMALRTQAVAMAGPDVTVGRAPWPRLKFMIEIMREGILPQANRTIDEFIAAGAAIQCRDGCSFCCYQNVDATIPEAIMVALRLVADDDPRRAAVVETADAVKDLDDEARIATARPCPFLIDKSCSVYEDRPLACRSLTSPDAARCHQAMDDLQSGRGVAPIDTYVVLRFLCSGEQAATRGICRDLGLQDDFVELSQAVAAIVRDPTLIERWASGERVFHARQT